MIARDDAENSSGNIVHGQEQGSEQIEGLDWDMEKLSNEIDCCLLRLRDGGRDDDGDGDVLLDLCDEQQLTDLNQRLALCRVRAREYKYRELDDESLAAIFPPSNLESNGYYEHYECNLEWFFDPEYCNYADMQDYQRLVLRDKGEYEDWEYYRKTCSTLEGDQQFIQFWEKLSSKTELLHLYLTDNSSELHRIERLVFYHALKIAEGLPHVLMTLVHTGFQEIKWSLRFYHTWYKYYAGFIFNMRELVTKQKMNFKDAFRRIHNEGKYDYCTRAWKAEFEKDEPNLYMLDEFYKPYLDRIGEMATEDYAYQHPVIMDTVKTIVIKPKTYYDYVKKKLDIAKQIGLICRNP